jgi:hypothetical protein
MASTHDGIQTPLAPSRLQQLLSLVGLAAAVGLGWQGWYCTGSGLFVIAALVFGNQLGGVTRVRVTFSKLLVEDERPVRGFLIGPSKSRIPWEEFTGVDVLADRVVAKGKSTTLTLGLGRPADELEGLAKKIREGAERFEREKA